MAKRSIPVRPGVQIHDGGVYLIHLDEPFKGTQHYIGFARNNMGGRMWHHFNGNKASSSYMAAVKAAGIGWTCVRTWPGESRTFERSLKNWKNAALFCPCCKRKKVAQKREQQRARKLKRNKVLREMARETRTYKNICHHLHFLI